MLEIKPRESFYSFSLSADRLYVAPAVGGAVVVAGKLVWDVILAKLVETIIKEVGTAIGKEVASRLFGSKTPWEQEISSNMREVIAKLDQILDEIAALREYWKEDARQQWRNILDAQVTTHIKEITKYFEGARSAGKLTDPLRSLITLQLNDLSNALGNIANYRDPTTKQPVTLPLYAAIEAGVIMAVLTQRALDLPPEVSKSTVNEYCGIFSEWSRILEEKLAPIRAWSVAEVALLDGWPKKGAMAYATNPAAATNQSPMVSLWFVLLQGGANNQFSFELVQEEIDYFNNGPYLAYPFPYGFEGISAGLAETVGNQIAYQRGLRMVSDLNARRAHFLEQLDLMRGIQEVISSLDHGRSRMAALLPTAVPELRG